MQLKPLKNLFWKDDPKFQTHSEMNENIDLRCEERFEGKKNLGINLNQNLVMNLLSNFFKPVNKMKKKIDFLFEQFFSIKKKTLQFLFIQNN